MKFIASPTQNRIVLIFTILVNIPVFVLAPFVMLDYWLNKYTNYQQTSLTKTGAWIWTMVYWGLIIWWLVRLLFIKG